MATITIPKKLAQKDDLVIIPKQEYKEFSLWKKSVRVRTDENWFWNSEWQKKEAEADNAIKNKKIFGPFSDYQKLISSLKKRRGL